MRLHPAQDPEFPTPAGAGRERSTGPSECDGRHCAGCASSCLNVSTCALGRDPHASHGVLSADVVSFGGDGTG